MVIEKTGNLTLAANIPIGFPSLPQVGSQMQFEIMREWLRVCDESKTHACQAMLEGPLPSRVVDVGNECEEGILHLHCTTTGEKGKFIALSHRWGDSKAHPVFRTNSSNIEAFQKHIDFVQLPQTFQDAVVVTQRLGVRFLWIDSLCIIQDDPQDWETQSVLMEDVFNCAYCTIAATCAEGSSDGFLKPRPRRNTVKIRQKSGDTYYVCEAIDDFHAEVEASSLNQRGWVLQERALSHRTIYFAKKQMYWECGEGVHCETLTKMRK